MHQRHPAGDVRQIQRLFDRGIATADHDDVLTLVEKSVAGCASRHAFAHERLLRRQPQIPRRRAGSDNERVAGIRSRIADQAEWTFVEPRAVNLVEDDLGLEALGVQLKPRHQVRALNAGSIGRPVVDVGSRHELSALREARDEHRPQVGARSVYCGGEPRRTGTEDQQAGVFGSHGCRRSRSAIAVKIRAILTDVGVFPGDSNPMRLRVRPAYNVSREIRFTVI